MSTTFRIIEKLGGQKAVELALTDSGHTVTYRAIRYWHEGGKIPDARQAQLIRLASNRGIKWSLDDLEPYHECEGVSA